MSWYGIQRSQVRSQYRPLKKCLGLGLAHLIDGLVLILSLGYLTSGYSADASVEILRHAVKLREQETAAKLKLREQERDGHNS